MQKKIGSESVHASRAFVNCVTKFFLPPSDAASEEHANIWGTWHSTLKPALKDQPYTGKPFYSGPLQMLFIVVNDPGQRVPDICCWF